jgi:hypothetical protein
MVIVPSSLGVGEEFEIKVKVLTDPFFARANCYHPSPGVEGRYNISPRGITYMDNVPPEWRGEIQIEGGEGYQGPRSFSFEERGGPYPGDRRPIRSVPGGSYSSPGLKSIQVRDPETSIEGFSNPVEVTEDKPEERLYWGDIHSQTYFSDGLRCPEELYAFAREEAFLDIFALADHAESLTDRQWEYFVNVTNDSYEPNRFVTLVGFEWTSMEWGHRNVYYPASQGPILRPNDPVHGQLPELYRVSRENGALVIPHHSANAAMGVPWSLGHDPEMERLVEIYSVWGNSERPGEDGNPRPIRVLGGETAGQHVVDALAMGRIYGFIGGGDIHDGRPGDELHTLQRDPDIYPLIYRQGIMGVWARELTRESIFDALWNRRVYATTNVRVILRFSVDGNPMGSQVTVGNTMGVRIFCASDVPVARVDLVHSGDDQMSIGSGERTVEEELSIETSPGGWIYVRILRQDGEMAWSSPVWYERA